MKPYLNSQNKKYSFCFNNTYCFSSPPQPYWPYQQYPETFKQSISLALKFAMAALTDALTDASTHSQTPLLEHRDMQTTPGLNNPQKRK